MTRTTPNVRLMQIGREVEARVVRAKKAEDHATAIEQLLVEARQLCENDKAFEKWKTRHCPSLGIFVVSRTRFYEKLRIAAGKTTAEEVREKTRKRVQKHRAKKKPAPVTSVTSKSKQIETQAQIEQRLKANGKLPDAPDTRKKFILDDLHRVRDKAQSVREQINDGEHFGWKPDNEVIEAVHAVVLAWQELNAMLKSAASIAQRGATNKQWDLSILDDKGKGLTPGQRGALTKKQGRVRDAVCDAYREKFPQWQGGVVSAKYIRAMARSLETGIEQPILVEQREQIERNHAMYEAELAAEHAQPFTPELEKHYTARIKERRLIEGDCERPWQNYFAYRDAHSDEVETLDETDLAYVGQWTTCARRA
jgi:hypothetical protein